MPTPIITLLTDFGNMDPYVGIMKGVILRICPEARIVDLTHEVIPYQIAQAAFLLEESWRYFPAGSIHVVVVDPGVGTARRPIVAEAEGHYFVGPDNGVFSFIETTRAWEIDGEPASHTFHGRDLFAPTAARLASGIPPERAVYGLQRLSFPRGKVLHIDRFGNVIVNVRAAEYSGPRVATYAEGPVGELFFIEGSSGYMEIALNQGNAAQRLGVGAGDIVDIPG